MSETITKTVDETRAAYRRWLEKRGLASAKQIKASKRTLERNAKRKGKK